MTNPQTANNSTVSRTLAADTSDGHRAENSTVKQQEATPRVESKTTEIPDFLLSLKAVRAGSKTSILKKRLGGNWSYCGNRMWKCEDGRTVMYTARPLDQFDNPCGESQCWLYQPNGPTKPFSFFGGFE
jgi:hypothetical protein